VASRIYCFDITSISEQPGSRTGFAGRKLFSARRG
jgi:hypothetical protein